MLYMLHFLESVFRFVKNETAILSFLFARLTRRFLALDGVGYMIIRFDLNSLLSMCILQAWKLRTATETSVDMEHRV